MEGGTLVVIILAVLVLFVIAKTAVVVPQQSAYVVERLGKYSSTLNAGFHILVPFVDVIRYKHMLKESAVDIPEQVCIARDNVQVHVDGILYMRVLNPERASYGINDYQFGLSQLAQTALRSEIGKIELYRSFEERPHGLESASCARAGRRSVRWRTQGRPGYIIERSASRRSPAKRAGGQGPGLCRDDRAGRES